MKSGNVVSVERENHNRVQDLTIARVWIYELFANDRRCVEADDNLGIGERVLGFALCSAIYDLCLGERAICD